MNRRKVFTALAGAIGAAAGFVATRAKALETPRLAKPDFMTEAIALDGANGWPKLSTIYPPVVTRNLSEACLRHELYAAINSLDQNKSAMARDLLVYLTSEKSGCVATASADR